MNERVRPRSDVETVSEDLRIASDTPGCELAGKISGLLRSQ
jgi:hypothetical protein